VKIRIKTTFIPLISTWDDLPDGVTLIPQRAIEKRSDGYGFAEGVLTFVSGVSVSIIGAWIYDKIKEVKDKPQVWIKINEKIVRQIDEDSITEAIQREIEISKK